MGFLWRVFDEELMLQGVTAGTEPLFDSTPSETETPEERHNLNPIPDKVLRRTNPKRYDTRHDWYIDTNESGQDSPISNRYDNPLPTVASLEKSTWKVYPDWDPNDPNTWIGWLVQDTCDNIYPYAVVQSVVGANNDRVMGNWKHTEQLAIEVAPSKITDTSVHMGRIVPLRYIGFQSTASLEELDWEIESTVEASTLRKTASSVFIPTFVNLLVSRAKMYKRTIAKLLFSKKDIIPYSKFPKQVKEFVRRKFADEYDKVKDKLEGIYIEFTERPNDRSTKAGCEYFPDTNSIAWYLDKEELEKHWDGVVHEIVHAIQSHFQGDKSTIQSPPDNTKSDYYMMGEGYEKDPAEQQAREVGNEFKKKSWQVLPDYHHKKEFKDYTEYYNKEGQLHRLNGPAVEWFDGYKLWHQNGKLHRLDGPALEDVEGTKVWYIDGIELAEEEFNQRTRQAGLKLGWKVVDRAASGDELVQILQSYQVWKDASNSYLFVTGADVTVVDITSEAGDITGIGAKRKYSIRDSIWVANQDQLLLEAKNATNFYGVTYDSSGPFELVVDDWRELKQAESSLKLGWKVQEFKKGDKVTFLFRPAEGEKEYIAIGKIDSIIPSALGISTEDLYLLTAHWIDDDPDHTVRMFYTNKWASEVEALDWDDSKQLESSLKLGWKVVLEKGDTVRILSKSIGRSYSKYNLTSGEVIGSVLQIIPAASFLELHPENPIVGWSSDRQWDRVSDIYLVELPGGAEAYFLAKDLEVTVSAEEASKVSFLKLATNYIDENEKMFQGRFNTYGEDGPNIFWSSERAQKARFEVLSKIADLEGKSVLDVGCGYGDLVDYFKDEGIHISKYVGVDVVQDIVDVAKKKHSEVEFETRDLLIHPYSENSFDYALGSGIFALSGDDWEQYVIDTLGAMLGCARGGVGVNFLKGSKDSSSLHKADPLETLLLVEKHVRGKAILVEGYLPDDFTIFIFKESEHGN